MSASLSSPACSMLMFRADEGDDFKFAVDSIEDIRTILARFKQQTHGYTKYADTAETMTIQRITPGVLQVDSETFLFDPTQDDRALLVHTTRRVQHTHTHTHVLDVME